MPVSKIMNLQQFSIHLKRKVNLARGNIITLFVCSLCKVQAVTFDKLANIFDTHAQSDTSLRGIQRFVSG